MNETNPELITKAELAKRMHKSPKTVERWVKDGYLPAIKLGHSTLFCWQDVIKHLKDNFTIN